MTAGIAYASSSGSGWDRLDSAAGVMTIGALAIVGHAVYDISTASRCDERRAPAGALHLDLVPGRDHGPILIVARASF